MSPSGAARRPAPAPRLASLRNKLALLFLAITATAFGVLYFFVVPQLESNLREQRIQDLERLASSSRPTLEGLFGDVPSTELDRRIRAVADAANARVTLLGIQLSEEDPSAPEAASPRFYVISDSREERDVPLNERLAERAVRGRNTADGTTGFQGQELGQVAQPLAVGGTVQRVALYSRDLKDVAETVSFIRRRLLVASAVALLVALIGGTLVAQALARRVRRLEAAAEEVAAGHFIDPLPVESSDELGQLTRAFNEMQSQLRRVDVARKEFVATASHELRTPIFSLGGFVELLRDEDLDEATRNEFLETMAEQVERLQKLAVDLLDLSRLDAGEVDLQLEQVDLAEVARAVAGEFLPAAQTHRTELALELPDDGVEAACDRERVVQIMRILLDNALRHTPEGTRVTVTASNRNGSASLTVADQGPGLPAGTRVFERFTTGDAARGAGLGLAIALELAERMDGALEAADAERGAQFTLELPAGGAEEPA